MSWRKIPCKISELRLDITLACGQSFRWHRTGPGEWTGVLAGRVWTLTQDDTHIFYKIHGVTDVEKQKSCHRDHSSTVERTGDSVEIDNKGNTKSEEVDSDKLNEIERTDIKLECNDRENGKLLHITDSYHNHDDHEEILRDYFQLHVNIEDLYQQWSLADKNFRSVAGCFSGVRILRQAPVENLFSFICSSNNNIARISGMVERMSAAYGQKLLILDDKEYHSFPTVESLATPGVEETLRSLGFGYRAKYISQSACYIVKNHSTGWLYGLRKRPYEEAKAELMKLCGVGAKVADCVCLMSLDKPGAIPVDTHVWQIAVRDYLPSLKQTKSLTETTYKLIGDHFRDLYGEYAGWAHSVLFSADLKKFKEKKREKRGAVDLVKENSTSGSCTKSGTKKRKR